MSVAPTFIPMNKGSRMPSQSRSLAPPRSGRSGLTRSKSGSPQVLSITELSKTPSRSNYQLPSKSGTRMPGSRGVSMLGPSRSGMTRTGMTASRGPSMMGPSRPGITHHWDPMSRSGLTRQWDPVSRSDHGVVGRNDNKRCGTCCIVSIITSALAVIAGVILLICFWDSIFGNEDEGEGKLANTDRTSESDGAAKKTNVDSLVFEYEDGNSGWKRYDERSQKTLRTKYQEHQGKNPSSTTTAHLTNLNAPDVEGELQFHVEFGADGSMTQHSMMFRNGQHNGKRTNVKRRVRKVQK